MIMRTTRRAMLSACVQAVPALAALPSGPAAQVVLLRARDPFVRRAHCR